MRSPAENRTMYIIIQKVKIFMYMYYSTPVVTNRSPQEKIYNQWATNLFVSTAVESHTIILGYNCNPISLSVF